MHALHLQLDGLAIKFERRDPLAIGWKPLLVAAFGIMAEGCDLEVGVAFQNFAELLREARSVFHALVLGHMFEIEVADRIGEVPGAVIGEEREHGALWRIAMQWVLAFRRGPGWWGFGGGLGAGGGTETQPGTEKRQGEMGGRRRKNVPAWHGRPADFADGR